MTCIKYLLLLLINYGVKFYLVSNYRHIKIIATYKYKCYIIVFSLHKKVINIRVTYNLCLYLFNNINVYLSNLKCFEKYIFNLLCYFRCLSIIDNLFWFIKLLQCCHINVLNHTFKFFLTLNFV